MSSGTSACHALYVGSDNNRVFRVATQSLLASDTSYCDSDDTFHGVDGASQLRPMEDKELASGVTWGEAEDVILVEQISAKISRSLLVHCNLSTSARTQNITQAELGHQLLG